jgi:diguanylate cyclase (GGDEF)-like protein/PAS domain S-box-containing protein
MLTNSIRHHVIVDAAGYLLGVISQSDLINQLGLEFFVELRKVEQVMSSRVATSAAHLPLDAVLAQMAGPGISCVVIEEGGKPLGIITERDAVRLVAEGVDTGTVTVRAGMSAPVTCVGIGSSVHHAAQLMKQEKIRRVVVTDASGSIAGIITQSDIVKGLEKKYIESLQEIIREKEDIVQQTAQELVDKTVYLDNILRSATDMAIIATDIDLKIKYFNPVAEKILGYQAAAVVGRSALEFQTLAGIAADRMTRAKEIVRRKKKYTFTARIESNGELRYYDGNLSGIIDRQARMVGFVLMLHDITERRKQEEMIHRLAYHDALTGLPNRVLLSDRLAQTVVTAQRYKQRGALMLLDLDHFKDINDTLGHSMGDRLLQEVSKRLVTLLRKSDTVSRMGGDEFVLLLPNLPNPESSTTIAAKIVRAFRSPFLCEGHMLKVSASIGIADFPTDGMEDETLLKMADIALYRVKESGRDNFQHFSTPERVD